MATGRGLGTAMNGTETCTPERTRRHDHASNPPRSGRTAARRVASLAASCVGARRRGGRTTPDSRPSLRRGWPCRRTSHQRVGAIHGRRRRHRASPRGSPCAAHTGRVVVHADVVGDDRGGHGRKPPSRRGPDRGRTCRHPDEFGARYRRPLTRQRWSGRIIGNRLAAGAAAASVLVPPWIIPGTGLIVLAAALMWRTIRSEKQGKSGLGTE